MGNIFEKTSKNHILCHCEHCKSKRFISDRRMAQNIQEREKEKFIYPDYYNPNSYDKIKEEQIMNDAQIALAINDIINNG